MKRLRYEKTSDLTIKINLENGYWVRADALYNYESKRYDIKFYIKEDTIDKDVAIEKLNNQHVSFDGNRKTIKTDITQYVSVLLSQNYFDDSIKHYEYEIKCFDKGHEIFEEEKCRKRLEGGVA